ncbi:MAG: GGDEF domain-containing protein [Pseudomonadaceae bacterium]|nr:MAG: GGDEF domain-containing protein [Pseudomonadaceae bacterium]
MHSTDREGYQDETGSTESDEPVLQHPYLAEARELGFVQMVTTIATTFYAIPIAWLVVFALVYEKVPLSNFFVWVSVFFVYWVGSLIALRKFRNDQPSRSKHLLPVYIIIALEGVLWGAMFYILMGHDIELDAWSAILLVGIISVILPSYITFPKAFHVLLLFTWLAASVSVWLIADRFDLVVEFILTLMIYCLALAYIIRPIAGRVLEGIRLNLVNQELTDRLHENLATASHQAKTDALTGLLNRHALNTALSELIVRGERRRTRFSLLMMDIDFFKSINDNHGHDAGDKALQHVARRISAQLRVNEGDLCARFGGEEFVVLLPSTNSAEAMVVAERIRQAVESSPPEFLQTPITLSIGVATYQPGMTAEALLKAADIEVYAAKENGRNQVRLAPTIQSKDAVTSD